MSNLPCPASVNGVVGFKPTVGLVSRTHVVPISATQDTAGPMARSVADAALLLSAIAGSDPADPVTAEADRRKADFTAGLAAASLQGVRIGVLRGQAGKEPRLLAVFETALADLSRAGAVLVAARSSGMAVRSAQLRARALASSLAGVGAETAACSAFLRTTKPPAPGLTADASATSCVS